MLYQLGWKYSKILQSNGNVGIKTKSVTSCFNLGKL